MIGWAVIACDDDGVTIDARGTHPEWLADYTAPWAQQELEQWPGMGLIYMLVPYVDARQAVGE